MTTARLWTLGAVVAVLALIGGAIGLGVQPLLAAAATADASTTAAHTQNDALRLQLAKLSRVAATQSALEAQSAALTTAIPETLKLNTFTRDLRDTAALDGVVIQSIVPATGSAYAAPASSVQQPAAAATPSASAAPSAAPAPVAPVKSPWLGKTDPLITGANFVVVPVTVVVTGTDAATLAFASDVQRMGRLFAVSSVTSTTTDGVTNVAIVGAMYALDR
ncbi:hypothetical protein [uncultured Amnibacterium sp.]|uniref:hypothetical protein n=1 Tax=uncultured Amnibacterium sp. TaxID=1631851 RepID=UPI0035C97C58